MFTCDKVDYSMTQARQARERVHLRRLPAAIGATVTLIGAGILLAWFVGLLPFRTQRFGWSDTVIEAAICLCASGLAIALDRRTSLQKLIRLIAALALVVIGGAELFALFLPSAIPSAFLRFLRGASGPMAPVASLSFLLIGSLLVATAGAFSRNVRRVCTAIAAAILATAAITLLSYVVNLEFLFFLPELKRTPPLTALGLFIIAVGVVMDLRSAHGRELHATLADVRLIIWTSDAILIFTATTIALVAFALSQDRSEKLLANQMARIGEARRTQFDTVIRLKLEQVLQISTRPAIIAFFQSLPADAIARGHEAIAPLQASSGSFAAHGFSAFGYESVNGNLLASSGTYTASPQLVIPLRGANRADLLWQDGYILRSRMPIGDPQYPAGFIVAEQPLTELTRMHREAMRDGDTGDLVVCGLKADRQVCFPLRWNPKPGLYPSELNGRALPLTRAVRGETASTITMDFRKQRVMAAFGPIGATGLGMAVKMDMWELYLPIRHQFFAGLPFLILLVAGGVGLMRLRLRPLIASLEASRQQLGHMAQHDALTSLPNRMLFDDRLTVAMARARRSKKLMALMYLDIDHFKTINDKQGHQAGDAVLKWFAAAMVKAVRSSDTVARMGGDEFTILLEDIMQIEDAERIAGAIQKLVAASAQSFPDLPVLSASIGIAFYRGEDSTEEALLADADRALYESKNSGRNRYTSAKTSAAVSG